MSVRFGIAIAALVALLGSGQAMAQGSSGFSVGGTGSFEGTATGSFSDAGYASVSEFVTASNLGYCNLASCATVWNEANTADDGTQSGNTLTSGCTTYGVLNGACTGNLCAGMNYNSFEPLLAFTRSNTCLTPGYVDQADHALASANGYGFYQADRDLWFEAKSITNHANCTIEFGKVCSAISMADYQTFKIYLAACNTAGFTNNYQGCHTAFANGYARTAAGFTAWSAAFADTNHHAFCLVEAGLPSTVANGCSNVTVVQYAAAKAAAAIAVPLGFTNDYAKAILWKEAVEGSLDAACNTAHTSDCDAGVTLVQYQAIKTGIPACTAAGFTSYGSCLTAKALSYAVASADAALWNEALAGTLNASCTDKHSKNCDLLTRAEFFSVKNDSAACSTAGYTTFTTCLAAQSKGYALTAADAAIWVEAVGGAYDANCASTHPGKTCSDVDRTQYLTAKAIGVASANAVASIATAISGGGAITSASITDVLTSSGGTVDSDLTLSNPLHLSFVQDCIGSSATAANVASCSTTVDGTALNKHVVSEIAGGASGTITAALLQNAGVSSAAAGIAAGNTCGPNNNASCLTHVTATLSSASGFTTSTIETALATYFDGQVSSSDTALATSNLTKGCTSGSNASFQVPNPPPLCATVHWNCSSNTTGISVVYNDQGKGNIIANSSTFTGPSYQVTATLTVGSTTKTRTINGSFNVQTAISGAQQGYKTTSEPAWWRNYNALHRARDRCVAWGGSIATHADIVAANTALGSAIIGNGTRTIFAASNGDAVVSTGGKTQCSESWPSQNTLTWSSSSISQRCDGKSGFGRNFTILCKDVPSC